METGVFRKEGYRMSSAVKLESICKKFNKETVLRDVNADFHYGKIYGIVGKNGSGKTVLFKTIVGFVRPTSGHVYVKGKRNRGGHRFCGRCWFNY